MVVVVAAVVVEAVVECIPFSPFVAECIADAAVATDDCIVVAAVGGVLKSVVGRSARRCTAPKVVICIGAGALH